MQRKSKLRIAACICFCLVAALFSAFFFYLLQAENVSIYRSRETRTYIEISDYDYHVVENPEAPVGVEMHYRWKLHSTGSNENCLAFYLSHHNVQIYIGNELIYELGVQPTNRIGHTTNSNWVTIPVYPSDSGKTLTVVLTPLFENVVGSKVQFFFGSHFSILFDQLQQDFPQIFLSVLCIVLGLFIVAVQIFFLLRVKVQSWDLFFLGIFSLVLGIWRIADLKSAPFLFSANPMALGYISTGALFLCPIPLLLFACKMFSVKKFRPLTVLSLLFTATSLVVLILQVLNVYEFKQMLLVCHIMLLITVFSLPVMTLFRKQNPYASLYKGSWKAIFLVAGGILVDLLSFFVHSSSSHILFSLISVVLYAMIMFVAGILEATQKAYTDHRTGLGNKARWNEIMNEAEYHKEDIAIIMLDLNGLKRVNDSLGHEAGDRMIFNFANILRNTLPTASVVCRWGGDEFAVMISGKNSHNLEQYLLNLRHAVAEYNRTCGDPVIHYAAGGARSIDYPALTRSELLLMADDKMYRDKEAWYTREASATHS